MAEHTPGPLSVYVSDEAISIVKDEPDDLILARMTVYASDDPDLNDEVQMANARLFAAAPDLLDACKEALHVLTPARSRMDGLDRQRQWLQEAIAKAEGKTL
jgi:hypothetical protein